MTLRTKHIKHAIEKKLKLNDISVSNVLDTLIEIISQELKDGNSIAIKGFGKFETFTRYSRNGVDPRPPHGKIKIPAVRVVKFRAARYLKNLIKK